MSRIKKWFNRRKPKRERTSERERTRAYEEEKREFEMAMGQPFISIKIEMPEGYEDLRAQFLNLEKDERFLEEVKDLIKKNLAYRRGSTEPQS